MNAGRRSLVISCFEQFQSDTVSLWYRRL